MKRSDRQLEKQEIIKKLSEYGLQPENLESLSTNKLRCTLHSIRREMKNINKNVKIVIVNSPNNDYDSDCSYCDTDDSECEYCDTEDSEDSEISIDSIDHNVSDIDPNVSD